MRPDAPDQPVRLGPLEVQVGRVVPGESDPGPQLLILLGRGQRGIAGHGRGQRRGSSRIGRPLIEAPRGLVGRRPRTLERQGRLGQLVLKRLERSDRAAELVPFSGVVDRGAQAEPGDPEVVGGDRDLLDQVEAGRTARRRPRTAPAAGPVSAAVSARPVCGSGRGSAGACARGPRRRRPRCTTAHRLPRRATGQPVRRRGEGDCTVEHRRMRPVRRGDLLAGRRPDYGHDRRTGHE